MFLNFKICTKVAFKGISQQLSYDCDIKQHRILFNTHTKNTTKKYEQYYF